MLRRCGKEDKPGFCIFMHSLNGTDAHARGWHNLRNAQFNRIRFAPFVQGADFQKKPVPLLQNIRFCVIIIPSGRRIYSNSEYLFVLCV